MAPLIPLLKKYVVGELISRLTGSRGSKMDELESIARKATSLLDNARTFCVCAGKYDGLAETEDNPKGENIKYSHPHKSLQEALVDAANLSDTNYGFVFIEHLGQRSYLKV